MQNIQASRFQPLSSSLAITLPKAKLVEWWDRWKVKEFYLFGSVLRDDFQLEYSDIDASFNLKAIDVTIPLRRIYARVSGLED